MEKIDKFRDLLKDKYEIPISDYFKLTEEEKEEIVDIVLEYYRTNLETDSNMVHLYLAVLKEQLNIALEVEEYERVDIMTRTMNRLVKKYKIKNRIYEHQRDRKKNN